MRWGAGRGSRRDRRTCTRSGPAAWRPASHRTTPSRRHLEIPTPSRRRRRRPHRRRPRSPPMACARRRCAPRSATAAQPFRCRPARTAGEVGAGRRRDCRSSSSRTWLSERAGGTARRGLGLWFGPGSTSRTACRTRQHSATTCSDRRLRCTPTAPLPRTPRRAARCCTRTCLARGCTCPRRRSPRGSRGAAELPPRRALRPAHA